MKRSAFVALLAVLAAAGLGAAPLTASWVEGKVEKKSGPSWILLNMGDRLESGDTVRLAPSATAEFTDGKRRVALSASGVFPLDSLFKGGADANKKRAGTVDKLARLIDPNAAPTSTAVGGVRGAAVEPETTTLTWASESGDAKALLAEAKILVREGRFMEAALRFSAAADAADGDEKDAALYGKAWALAASDSALQAVKTLRAMPNDGPWAGPRALLLARLDLETGAIDEAKSLLAGAIDANLLAGDDLVLAKTMLDESAN